MKCMRAVIDRFEGSFAVLYAEGSEHQLLIPRELLPGRAEEGTCLTVSLDFDSHDTQLRRERMRNLLERVKKPPGKRDPS